MAGVPKTLGHRGPCRRPRFADDPQPPRAPASCYRSAGRLLVAAQLIRRDPLGLLGIERGYVRVVLLVARGIERGLGLVPGTLERAEIAAARRRDGSVRVEVEDSFEHLELLGGLVQPALEDGVREPLQHLRARQLLVVVLHRARGEGVGACAWERARARVRARGLFRSLSWGACRQEGPGVWGEARVSGARLVAK